MTKQCPNCSKEFTDQREGHFFCEDCGWFRNVDDKWRSCPEPVKVTEPDPKEHEHAVPTPSEPVLKTESDNNKKGEQIHHRDRLDSNVRSYLGGLVTVTETEDDENE